MNNKNNKISKIAEPVIKLKKLKAGAEIPRRATAGSAGYDLFAEIPGEMAILPKQTLMIPTGISIEITDANYAAFIYARSGLSVKYGINLANGVGVIDSDYRGEIIVALYNMSEREYIIRPKDRIAQIVFSPVIITELAEAEEIENSERGGGGFGSSGK